MKDYLDNNLFPEENLKNLSYWNIESINDPSLIEGMGILDAFEQDSNLSETEIAHALVEKPEIVKKVTKLLSHYLELHIGELSEIYNKIASDEVNPADNKPFTSFEKLVLTLHEVALKLETKVLPKTKDFISIETLHIAAHAAQDLAKIAILARYNGNKEAYQRLLGKSIQHQEFLKANFHRLPEYTDKDLSEIYFIKFRIVEAIVISKIANDLEDLNEKMTIDGVESLMEFDINRLQNILSMSLELSNQVAEVVDIFIKNIEVKSISNSYSHLAALLQLTTEGTIMFPLITTLVTASKFEKEGAKFEFISRNKELIMISFLNTMLNNVNNRRLEVLEKEGVVAFTKDRKDKIYEKNSTIKRFEVQIGGVLTSLFLVAERGVMIIRDDLMYSVYKRLEKISKIQSKFEPQDLLTYFKEIQTLQEEGFIEKYRKRTTALFKDIFRSIVSKDYVKPGRKRR